VSAVSSPRRSFGHIRGLLSTPGPRAETPPALAPVRALSSERGHVLDQATPGGPPVFTFSWPFFVPSSSERLDRDLLRQAVELAHTDEIRTWRAAVQRWRRDEISCAAGLTTRAGQHGGDDRRLPPRGIPEELEAAAMFHEARRLFR
jgi:hypothetical protein